MYSVRNRTMPPGVGRPFGTEPYGGAMGLAVGRGLPAPAGPRNADPSAGVGGQVPAELSMPSDPREPAARIASDTQEDQAERLRAQRGALARFGLFAFRSDDLDAVLHRACELVAEGLGAEMAKVLEHRPERGDFLVRAGVGWKPGVVGRETFAGGAADSPAGYALGQDGPVILRDVASETRFAIPDVLHDHGVQSMVNVVIAGEDGAYGVLEVDAPCHRDFDDEDAAFLKTYANLLAR